MKDEIVNYDDDVGGLISGITFAKSYSENKALFN